MLDAGNAVAAAQAITELSAEHPDHPEVLELAARYDFARGATGAAGDVLDRLLARSPKHDWALFMRADLHEKAGDFERGFRLRERAMNAKPKVAVYAAGTAKAASRTGRHEESIVYAERAAMLAPKDQDAWLLLTELLQKRGRPDAAAEACRRGLAQLPGNTDLLARMGFIRQSQGRHEESVEMLAESWNSPRDAVTRATIVSRLTHHLYTGDDPALINEIAASTGAAQPLARTEPPTVDARAIAREREGKVRLGYMSPDFFEHPVSQFLEPILAQHDRDRFEIALYSSTTNDDAMSARLRDLADRFVDVRKLPDRRLLDLLAQDRQHVLIDLGGYTSNSKAGVFAHRVAPVQVSWIGFPASLALPNCDARLVDAVTDPPELEAPGGDPLVRLDGVFLCFRVPAEAPEPSPAPALDSGRVTFGSMNRLAKISGRTFELWCDVLRAIPSSRMFMKSREFAEATTAAWWRERFAEAGVDPARIELIAWTETRAEHFQLYDRMDMALDTFPYCGTTTTCEAAWMGVPTITLAGRAHHARVGASLLGAMGLSQLVAESPEAFVELAAALAGDVDRLNTMRLSMRDRVRTSVLCDAEHRARSVERVYLDLLAQAAS